MDIIRQIRDWMVAPSLSAGGASQVLKVRCNRCGEVLPVRINMMNDLSVEYNDRGDVTGYFCRKVAQGKGMCFQTVEIDLTYGPARVLVNHMIQGGTLVKE
jgi:hypothetical protein